MLITVNASVKKLVTLEFIFEDTTKNYTIDLLGDKVYEIIFAYEAELIRGVGQIKDIITDDDGKFKLVFDCSTNYNSNVIHIRQDLIRSVKETAPSITITPPPPAEEEEGEF